MNTKSPGDLAQKRSEIVVQVRYLAAGHPLTDPHAAEDETLAELKLRALSHFELVEGQVEGGTKTYALSQDGVLLSDLSVTLGNVADGDRKVTLILLEQFIQG